MTYNPDDCSIKAIRTIIDSAVHTVILDNCSSEEHLLKIRKLAEEKVSVVPCSSNTGIAGGLNRGIEAAAALGYRWFVLFDQDTNVFPNTIASLVRIYNECLGELGSKLGMLGCNYHHMMEDGTIAEAKVPMCEGRSWCSNVLIITSGTLISLETYRTIGAFREDFFIDHVDHEYQLRALRLGLVVCRTSLPLTVHRLGMLQTRRVWAALGRKKMLSFYPPLRRYYQIRNFAVLAREYERDFPEFIDFIRRSIRCETRRALKYEGQFYQNLMSVLLARRHSQNGTTGKYNGGFVL